MDETTGNARQLPGASAEAEENDVDIILKEKSEIPSEKDDSYNSKTNDRIYSDDKESSNSYLNLREVSSKNAEDKDEKGSLTYYEEGTVNKLDNVENENGSNSSIFKQSSRTHNERHLNEDDQTKVDLKEPNADDDLGIYEDNADGDDLTDTEEPSRSRHVRITINKDQRRHHGAIVDDNPASEADQLRRKTNTPASVYTDVSDLKSADFRGGRFTESRESMFNRAMTLMSQRCLSRVSKRVPSTLLSETNPPFGYYKTQYFYIAQNRPSPMPPLKAWRGYNGNVYFEPIKVNTLSMLPGAIPSRPLDRCSTKLSNIISRSRLASRSSNKENESIKNPASAPHHRSTSQASSFQSGKSVKYRDQRQMCILDRNAVLNIFDENIHNDIIWLNNQESTGTLKLLSQEPNIRSKIKYEKERIIKGSVVHRSYERKSTDKTAKTPRVKNNIDTRGLRSVSSSALHIPAISANTPDVDMYGSFTHYDKLPPLDQVESSLHCD